jgi:hypothetical protein
VFGPLALAGYVTWPEACVANAESVKLALDPAYGTYHKGVFPSFEDTLFTNTEGVTSSVVVEYDVAAPYPAGADHGVIETVDPPGCATPDIDVVVDEATWLFEVPAVPAGTMPAFRFIARLTYPTACVDTGESLLFRVTPAALFQPTADFSPPPIPTVTPTPFPAGGRSLILDCDVNAAGIQSYCAVSLYMGAVDIDVYLVNNGTPFELDAFNFRVDNPEVTRLDGFASPPCASPGYDCNPDLDRDVVTGAWACGPPLPTDDDSADPSESAFMSCFDGALDGPQIDAGAQRRLATVHYAIPSEATAGDVPLAVSYVGAYDDTFDEIFSCNPPTVNPGTCIGATISLVDTPLPGTVTPTPTSVPPTATPTSGGSGATPTTTPITEFFFAIDCDARSPGLQSVCTYPVSAGAFDVGTVLGSNLSDPLARVQAFDISVRNTDTSRLLPPVEGPDIDGNPDLNQALLGLGYGCTSPFPTADTGQGGPGTSVSHINCVDLSPPPLPRGANELASVRYNIVPGATTGSIVISPFEIVMFGDGDDIGRCGFAINNTMPCLPATIILVDPSTVTPTPTSPPEVIKIPDGNPNNADLSVPAANLWICAAPAACGGPGEGELRVVERASGVLDGLGAYEFTVEYDPFVIQSVNPCDLVFGTTSPPGAGAARGPVDELDSSSENPDCNGDPGGANNGTCALSLVLENLVHFGCVTNGQTPGPTGDFDLASLWLIPHPDLKNDLFPGNNNGVLTVIKDNGCELVDILGHPVTGSVNGGLTPFCGDLAVTVRILEGDLDLDCDVDLQDAQAIAGRYGAFFGGLLYSKWYDLEPQFHDLDIDIKDVQKVFGRDGSSCQTPIPAQPPLSPPAPFG